MNFNMAEFQAAPLFDWAVGTACPTTTVTVVSRYGTYQGP